jgi:hypothetical protein
MAKKLKMSEHQVYMNEKKGPFRCDNCEYYGSTNHCNNDVIVQLAYDGKFGLYIDNGHAWVDPAGCSDEFKRK